MSNSAAACKAPVWSKMCWEPRNASGNETMLERVTTGPGAITGQLISTWSSEAFPQIPQLDEAKKCRSAKSIVKGTVRSTVTTL